MSLTNIELRKILKKYGLSDTGKRPDLVTRLKEHLLNEEEDEAQARPAEMLGRLEQQLKEIRETQEHHTSMILKEIRDRVSRSLNPPPSSSDETSDLLSTPPPSTSNDVVNNNFSSPMPPEETVVMRMRRQRAMSKISALAQEKALPESDTEEEL